MNTIWGKFWSETHLNKDFNLSKWICWTMGRLSWGENVKLLALRLMWLIIYEEHFICTSQSMKGAMVIKFNAIIQKRHWYVDSIVYRVPTFWIGTSRSVINFIGFQTLTSLKTRETKLETTYYVQIAEVVTWRIHGEMIYEEHTRK